MLTLFDKFNHKTPKAPVPDSAQLIDLRWVDKTYASQAGIFLALREINLCIGGGELVAVVGKSGSGKTTLLNMITGIDRPTRGEIWVNGKPIHRLSEERKTAWRGRSIGIVFQFFQLIPTLTILENIVFAMDLVGAIPRQQRQERARMLLDEMDLMDHAAKLPSAVSGGQQQRAAIARALANDPPILIADEPTGNLDSITSEAVFDLFTRQVAQGKTVILVTHDTDLADKTQRIIRLKDGQVVDDTLLKPTPQDGKHENTEKVEGEHEPTMA
jgi:putative ABC transport system ATP-binding protein